MNALVSVVTPTWQRPEELLERCIPSVRAQTYPATEHVVIIDGPGEGLGPRLAAERWSGLVWDDLPEHKEGWTGAARRRGCELAGGEFIAYLDDDDAYRPEHVANLVWALQTQPWHGFAYSHMMVHMPSGARLTFRGPPGVMMGTPMIMHRREMLDIANWDDGIHEDTALVRAWLDAGITCAEVTMTTVDVYPGPATTAAITGSLAFGSLEWE